MNEPLLRRIQRQLDKTPQKFSMSLWCSSEELGWHSMDCNTTMCIGGLAAFLSGKRFNPNHCSDEYGTLLGLDPDQASRLFFTTNWPMQFEKPYNTYYHAGDHPAMAGITNRRIDHFIATGGKE